MLAKVGMGFLLMTVPAASAELWQCQLHPVDDPSDKVVFTFEVRKSRVVRSPDDFSNQPMTFEMTTDTPQMVVAENWSQKIGVKIDRTKAEVTMTGGNPNEPGWLDLWTGPCTKR